MTRPDTLLFSVSLRHLTADGKKCGLEFPAAQLRHVSVSQLETLLLAVDEIAPSVAPPAEPEVRISGATGDFVVRINAGQLHMVTWSSHHKVGAATPTQIVAAITGEEASEALRSKGSAGQPKSKGGRETLTLVALGLAILLVNSFTVWILTRPPRGFLPKYRLLAPEQAQRVLADVAGVYETGRGPGDRRLEVGRNASAQRIKLGPGGSVKDIQSFAVQAAEAEGNKALITSRKSLITIKDGISVVLYGDTYTRVTN